MKTFPHIPFLVHFLSLLVLISCYNLGKSQSIDSLRNDILDNKSISLDSSFIAYCFDNFIDIDKCNNHSIWILSSGSEFYRHVFIEHNSTRTKQLEFMAEPPFRLISKCNSCRSNKLLINIQTLNSYLYNKNNFLIKNEQRGFVLEFSPALIITCDSAELRYYYLWIPYR